MIKKLKYLMTAVCMALLFATMPGMSVLADEMEEELIANEAEVTEKTRVSEDSKSENVTDSADVPMTEEIISQDTSEEVVGEDAEQVGDGVTATFDEETGTVEFFSDGGTLWENWKRQLGILNSDDIKSIKVASGIVYLPADSYRLFGDCSNLTNLDLRGFNTSNVVNMSRMFYQCRSLSSLDLGNFDTSNVTKMSGMFAECNSLINLDLSSFNTSNVTSMHAMFYGCDSLTNLDLSSFNTSNVTDMYSMFNGCRSLVNLDLSSFNKSNVTDMMTSMQGMFYGCSGLINLDLSNFNTSRVCDMYEMFKGCNSLTNLDLSSFDTSNVYDMRGMFEGCSCLTNLNLSSFDTSNVGGMSAMFSGCSSLKDLDLSSLETSDVGEMSAMFSGCSRLEILLLDNFDTSNVAYMDEMFRDCSSLKNLDLRSFDTSNVTNMREMFYGCSNLQYLDLSGFDTSRVTKTEDLFLKCDNLQVLITPEINKQSIPLPHTMYDLAGNQYSEIPAYSDCIVLTKEPRQGKGHPVKREVEIMDEKGDKRNEEVSFFWDVETLEYRRVPYDYDLAIAAAYINQGTYFSGSENETKDRMKDLDFEHFEQNHPYNDWSIFEPWMAIGYQTCSVNGSEKKIVCLNVRGTKHPLTDWTCQNIIQGWGTGFVSIGQRAFDFLSAYCERQSINLNDPDTILFLAGHSLGGAAVSRLAIELDEKNYQTKIIAYAFGTPNYSCGNSNPKGLHTVWNEGDIVASMGGIFTSHTGQIIKFSHYTRNGREKGVNAADHDMARYVYRTFRLAGKMSSLSANTLTYTFVDGFEDEICPVDPNQYLEITNNLEQADSNKLGTKYGFHCPVDVRVYNADNILVGDSTNDDFMFTDGSGGYIYLSDDEKYVFLPAGSNYRIDISGTDDGTMNVDVMEIDPFGEEINSMSYENVSIETDKHFILDAQSMNTVDESDLFVVQDESVPVAFVQMDGTEVPLLGSGLVCEGVTWSVDTAGELTISGRGGIPSFTDADAAPWSGLSDKITSVTIGDGITAVGNGAFAGIPALKTAKVPSTVAQIGAKAFSGCTGLETVLFYGDMPEIDSSAFEGLSLEVLYYNENNTWEEKPDLGEEVIYSGYCGFTSEGLTMEHSFENETVGPDCTSFGYGLYHCTTCGYAYATDFVESPGHDWGSWEIIKDATEDADGEEQRSCLRCHEKETRIINKLVSIAVCTVALSSTSYTYNGKERKPSVTVTDGTFTLTSGTDYTVSYSNNTNAGTATVTITGKGVYTGTNSTTFTIKKATSKLVFAEADISKKATDAAFTNTLTKTTDGTVTFKSSDTKVAEVNSTSGQVTIKGIGTTTISANAAEGTNYKAGSSSYTLTVEASAPTPAATGFSDVQDPSHPYYKAIYWAADTGITKGYSDGTFGINRSCTRGEMMMFLWRYAGKQEPKTVSKSPFKDVPKTHTFYKAILWGSQKGITKGYSDGTFGVNRNVSRGECMMFLWRLKGKPAPKAVAKSPFPDVPKSHVFYNAVLWGYQKKITTGFTSGKLKGKFGVNENCSRGQIVTFLYRAK